MAGRRDLRPVPHELRGTELRLFHYLQDIQADSGEGIPAGFLEVTPTTISAGTPASAGSEDSGWASGTHAHALDASGLPGDYDGGASMQGGGPGASLSGHTHAIPDGALVLEKLEDIPADTLLGNNDAGADSPEPLTTVEVTAMLELFTSLLQGLVPASGGGTLNFLRADGTWAPTIPTVLRPAQVVANQNDYSPGTLGPDRTTVLVSTDASRNFTGILATGIADGVTLLWINNGAQPEVLQHANGGSVAANQLLCPTAADLTLAATEAVLIVRDATAARWRVFRL